MLTKAVQIPCPYLHVVAYKGLIQTMMTAPRLNPTAEAILLHAKLCNIYRCCCLNYILNKSEVKLKNTNFVNKVFQRSRTLRN